MLKKIPGEYLIFGALVLVLAIWGLRIRNTTKNTGLL